jgi:polysaccharide deacetylase family protein (PEP-CTERM system associated)
VADSQLVRDELVVVNAMSVDVEDYFHVSVFDGVVPRHQWDRLESRVCANTDRLLAIFEEAGVHATFFVLGWVGERHPELVRRIVGLGHELASHGYAHRLVYDQTPAAFRDDVRRAKQVLEDASGGEVGGYRAPSYSVTPRSLWALDILIEEGYWYDASIFPILHDRYGIPVSGRHPYQLQRRRGRLTEVPGSTVRIGPLNLPVGGGGYFRILPYPPAGMVSRFRHYRNLDKTEERLRTLLRDFRFGPVRDLVRAHIEPSVGSEPAAAALPYFW